MTTTTLPNCQELTGDITARDNLKLIQTHSETPKGSGDRRGLHCAFYSIL